MLGDLQNPRWMYLKAILFVFLGTISAVLLFTENPTARTAFLIGLVAWSFSRAYYFAFYVIQKYIDPEFRFDGLLSVVSYLVRRRADKPNR